VFDGPVGGQAVRRCTWTGLLGLFACVAAACFSPVGAYREMRSDKHPTKAQLVGTWRVTEASARRAAATGLPLSDVQAGFLTLRSDGSCSANLFASPCGSFPTDRRHPGESCRWETQEAGQGAVGLTFGERPTSFLFGMHHLDSEPPILWQYICDPDSAEYLEFERERQ
jgi:hypothetical protein